MDGERFLIMRPRPGFEMRSRGSFWEARADGSGTRGRDFRQPGARVPSQWDGAQAGDAERACVSRVERIRAS